MEPPLIEQLGLEMGDKSSAVRLACRIVLGLQLQHQKQELGYAGCGTYWHTRKQFKPSERLRWSAYCMAVAGISDRSAEIYRQCAESAKTRLRCLGRPGSKALLRMMERPPSEMTPAQRSEMIGKLITLVLSVGETQQQLRREYAGVHLLALETIGESGNDGQGMSMAELYERYPDKEDASMYAISKTCGRTEESARLLVVVMREMRRRKKLGIKTLGS